LDKLTAINEDQKAGINIVKRALQAPIRQIVANAGLDGAVIAGKLLESKDEKQGFDAQNLEYKNLITAGIVDPTKVVRTSVQSAASVAGLLITTEALIADEEEEKDSGAGGAMGGMGGMDAMGGMGF